jgi:putative hydrolase of the HAD superfamily
MPIRALLFDLGGVILDVDPARCLAHWAPHSRLEAQALATRFGVDAAWEAHETGRLDTGGYLAHLRQALELACGEADVLAGWNAMLGAPIADTVALVDQLRGRLPLHVLSNTNAAHVAAIRAAHPGLLERFDVLHVSHELGWRKPHRRAFAAVLQALGQPPAEVLFFDDLPANVEAARAAGLQAVLVRGPADVRGALQDLAGGAATLGLP